MFKPRKKLNDICKFIGLEYSTDLLAPTQYGQTYQGNNHEGEKFQSINNSNIDRWKERLPSFPAKIIECQPNKYFDQFNYTREFTLFQKIPALVKFKLMTMLTEQKALYKGFFNHQMDERVFQTF